MGDPSHFSVKGGANPHTRDRFGRRRRVDRARAIAQWQRLRDTLRDLGLRVLVVPADPAQPGLVYPANAGFLSDVDAERALAEKTFYLSNLLPSRAGETPHYERLLRGAGFRVAHLDPSVRFEGEADFFPAGDLQILTWGHIERQRFVPALAWPPWRRVYGFRTDAAALRILAPRVAPRRVLRVELVLESHYHGDTCLCAFGPGREHLLAFRPALHPDGWLILSDRFDRALLELSDEDAARYAANAFSYTPPGQSGHERESFLVLPEGVSQRLKDQVRARGVTPLCVDVSEFLKKGGGSVKCMIGDLGPVGEEDLGKVGEA